MIVGVAIKRDGHIYALERPARHPNLFAEYNEDARAAGWDFPWKGWAAEDIQGRYDPSEQGFVDQYGEFMTRAQGEVHARLCGQLTKPIIGGVLTSEDLW